LACCSSSPSPDSFNTQYQVESITQVQTDHQSLLGKFSLCFAATVLIFFIAGLLYLLRFERVDNLGAYRIPPETGLLIPSGFVSLHYAK
jgi:hypothetical protein